jgi:S-adenosylmethionine:tRNA-ribosyltransferase-isomerase (queuine synthetase)
MSTLSELLFLIGKEKNRFDKLMTTFHIPEAVLICLEKYNIWHNSCNWGSYGDGFSIVCSRIHSVSPGARLEN